MASVLSAARTLGNASGWRQSNLETQKTLYIAHGIHLSANQRPLFAELFEAWDYGPVVPALYQVLKRFDRSPIQDVFDAPVYGDATTEAAAIREAWEIARFMSPGALVTYTHRPGGAWEAVYRPDCRGAVIPNLEIAREWEESLRASDETVDWAITMAATLEARTTRYLDFENERSFRDRVRQELRH